MYKVLFGISVSVDIISFPSCLCSSSIHWITYPSQKRKIVSFMFHLSLFLSLLVAVVSKIGTVKKAGGFESRTRFFGAFLTIKSFLPLLSWCLPCATLPVHTIATYL